MYNFDNLKIFYQHIEEEKNVIQMVVYFCWNKNHLTDKNKRVQDFKKLNDFPLKVNQTWNSLCKGKILKQVNN